jgi:hypothetical protein
MPGVTAAFDGSRLNVRPTEVQALKPCPFASIATSREERSDEETAGGSFDPQKRSFVGGISK